MRMTSTGKETWFQTLGALSWERSRNNWCLPVNFSSGWTCVLGNLWLNNRIDFRQNFFSQCIKILAVNKIYLQWRQHHRPLLRWDDFLHKFSWELDHGKLPELFLWSLACPSLGQDCSQRWRWEYNPPLSCSNVLFIGKVAVPLAIALILPWLSLVFFCIA